MDSTTSKTELKKQIDSLQKQITDVTKRRNDLKADLIQNSRTIESIVMTFGQALLAGRDSSNENDALITEKTKADGIRKAINQADVQLQEMNLELEKIKSEFSALDYERIAQELVQLIAVFIGQCYALVDSMAAINAKKREIYDLEEVVGRNLTRKSDALHDMTIIYQGLVNRELPTQGMGQKLKTLEGWYPRVFSKIREKKDR